MGTLDPTAIAQEILLESAGDLGRVEFHGNSMLPLLRDGDMLVVEPVAWDQIGPGDIVVHRFDDKYPSLRVMEKLPDKLFLKADNWPAPIFEAWRDDVLGRVAGLRRDGVETACTARGWWRAARTAVLEYRLRSSAASVRRRARSLARRVRADVAAFRAGMVGMPEALQLNVSSVCNLECRMCPYLGVHQDDSVLSFMTSETFERLLPAIKHIGAVVFSGSGEPLYNKNLLSFIERTRAECPTARISLTTNGTLLRRDVAAELVRLRLDTLVVSIDGATAQTMESIRLNSDFARIVGHVEQLAELKRERGARFPRIFANFMVGYGTYRELPDFVRLAKRMGVEEVHLLEIQPSCHSDVRDNLAAGVQRDDGRQLRYAIQIGQRLGVGIQLPRVSPNACLMPYHPHVAENGEIYPCCFLDYDGRQLFDGRQEVKLEPLSFGNTDAKDFRTLWNSRDYVSFRRRNKKGDFPDGCRTCFDIRADTAHHVAHAVGRRPHQPGR